jgi:hypothetical protein
MKGSNLICVDEILKCIEYDISSEDSKCITCEAGYMIDSYFKCGSCELEYVEVSKNPIECAFKRDRCISYKLYQGEWVCDICRDGYKLDNEIKCNSYADGYSSASKEVLECILNDKYTPVSEDSNNNTGNQD